MFASLDRTAPPPSTLKCLSSEPWVRELAITASRRLDAALWSSLTKRAARCQLPDIAHNASQNWAATGWCGAAPWSPSRRRGRLSLLLLTSVVRDWSVVPRARQVSPHSGHGLASWPSSCAASVVRSDAVVKKTSDHRAERGAGRGRQEALGETTAGGALAGLVPAHSLKERGSSTKACPCAEPAVAEPSNPADHDPACKVGGFGHVSLASAVLAYARPTSLVRHLRKGIEPLSPGPWRGDRRHQAVSR